MSKFKSGDIITVSFDKTNSSNTCIIKSILDIDNEISYLISHPLYSECYLIVKESDANIVPINMKCSMEKCIDFAKHNQNYLDLTSISDLESIALYFVVKRKLTSKQKKVLSNICGKIATIRFDSDIQKAMSCIVKNEALLDDFNMMWYRNFNGIFSGRQYITSDKQRASIFNMAGFILAELENPRAPK